MVLKSEDHWSRDTHGLLNNKKHDKGNQPVAERFEGIVIESIKRAKSYVISCINQPVHQQSHEWIAMIPPVIFASGDAIGVWS